METAQDILKELVCGQCGSQLRRGPVFQRQDGAACSPCQEQEGAPPASRNHVYEAAARALAFPCRYREEGCPASVPFTPAGASRPEHEDACEYRLYTCPVLGPEGCDWAGRRDALLPHCEAQHPDRVLSTPALVTPDIRRSQSANYLVLAHQLLFLLLTRVCTSGSLYYSVRLLGEPRKALDFAFSVSVRRGQRDITYSQPVLPQEHLLLKQHSALSINISSVLGVLGGWDGATLAVEVRALQAQAEPRQAEPASRQAQAEPRQAEPAPRQAQAEPRQAEPASRQAQAEPRQAEPAPRQAQAEPRQAEPASRQAQAEPRQAEAEPRQAEPEPRQAEATLEKCGRCGAHTARLYRDKEQRWLCEACAPALQTCSNRRCNFQDFPGKSDKHIRYWCEQRSQCGVCATALQPGTLAQHYQTCRRLPGVLAGAGHRVPRGSWDTWFRVGDVLCWYGYPGDRFWLRVYAPVAARQLSGYRCEVRLECAGHTRTYTPPPTYHEQCDWEVKCNDKEFRAGDVTVYVSVTRADSTCIVL